MEILETIINLNVPRYKTAVLEKAPPRQWFAFSYTKWKTITCAFTFVFFFKINCQQMSEL